MSCTTLLLLSPYASNTVVYCTLVYTKSLDCVFFGHSAVYWLLKLGWYVLPTTSKLLLCELKDIFFDTINQLCVPVEKGK